MWYYKEKELELSEAEKYTGFVYLITNKISGRQYIGKKLFKFTRSKKIKGRRKKTKRASDWMKYYGSNKSLLEDVATHGQDNFKREILHLCLTKGICNYLEIKEQVMRGALESDLFYNDWIMGKVHRSHVSRLFE